MARYAPVSRQPDASQESLNRFFSTFALQVYAHAQLHPGGMIAEECQDGAMGVRDDEQ
jgi:hypothetical protein